MLDLLDRLLQLIERDRAMVEQGASIDRRLGALWTPIKQRDAERMLHVRDRLRDGRLRHGELCCRLSHAAAADHGQEHAQLAKFQVTTEPLRIPRHGILMSDGYEDIQ